MPIKIVVAAGVFLLAAVTTISLMWAGVFNGPVTVHSQGRPSAQPTITQQNVPLIDLQNVGAVVKQLQADASAGNMQAVEKDGYSLYNAAVTAESNPPGDLEGSDLTQYTEAMQDYSQAGYALEGGNVSQSTYYMSQANALLQESNATVAGTE